MHTRTHMIVRVSTEEQADTDPNERARAVENELVLERQKNREERHFLERRLVLLEQKLSAQEAYIERLAASSRAGLRHEARQAAAICGLCALIKRIRAREQLRDAFGSLRDSFKEAKIASLLGSARAHGAEERRQNIMLRIVKWMLNQAKAAAFERWKATVCELTRHRNILLRIVKRMLNQVKAAAFELWKAIVFELVRQRCIMGRILRHMLKRKMSAGKHLYVTRPAFACHSA
jgi:hypothetical protein